MQAANNRGADQTAQMRSLLWLFAYSINRFTHDRAQMYWTFTGFQMNAKLKPALTSSPFLSFWHQALL